MNIYVIKFLKGTFQYYILNEIPFKLLNPNIEMLYLAFSYEYVYIVMYTHAHKRKLQIFVSVNQCDLFKKPFMIFRNAIHDKSFQKYKFRTIEIFLKKLNVLFNISIMIGN